MTNEVDETKPTESFQDFQTIKGLRLMRVTQADLCLRKNTTWKLTAKIAICDCNRYQWSL